MNPLNETYFEEHITKFLAQSDLYVQRSPRDFDIEQLVDREMLEHFLRAQASTWNKLQMHFPGREVQAVIDEYNKLLNRGESMLKLLTKGLTLKGVQVKFVQFKPAIVGENDKFFALYRQNRFAVVRQMRYSNEAFDRGNELDLCILVNGLPIITCELKNEATGQNYNHGVKQYKENRNPHNRMLRACLVHFVMDNNYAFMTTQLAGDATRFLPFNKDSQNPIVDGDYATCYMWREILQADSLLDIIQNFIKRYTDEKGRTVTIFPRYHQLRAVRLMRRLVREEGPGHNYLIQHSAGSGKTKSMAWLAHQLANMTREDNTPIFDSIIMVTDRIVLNRNMAEDVVNFETVAGTVKDIRSRSKKLADALNEGGNRIIISTVQKFAYALKFMKRDVQRRYAIIVDEAHTAIGNESAKDIVSALTTDEDLKSIKDFTPDEYDSQMDALMAYMQSMRKQMPHISYFAFTATPKDKTYALFGKDGREPHDLYSMKQAIDEGFILDVLRYYRSYRTMFELKKKDATDTMPEELLMVAEDLEKKYGEKKALRVIYNDLDQDAYIMLRKATMMLDHFMKHTINKIGKRAKAMVVCDSRKSAVEYKLLLDRLIKDQYDGKIKTLVALSGEVEDRHGIRRSEANMNDDGVTDNDIALKFEEEDYKILVVAEKFQTGFDQPLLHTMYVDRLLGGIQCIQTLSRLNRCYPGKEVTMVIDFRNDHNDVNDAFQRYYTATVLEGEVDTQRMYPIKNDIEEFKIFNEAEVNAVVEALTIKRTAQAVPAMLRHIVDERVMPLNDAQKDLYRKHVARYIRQYGFIAQLMDFTDPELEKFYVFLKVFYKFLPYTKEVLPMDILQYIDLDKLRLQMTFDGTLELEDEETKLQSSRIGEPSIKKPDEERTIQEILDIANEPYKGFLDENDKVLRQILEEILVDPEVNEAFQNDKNTYDVLMTLIKDKFDEKIAMQIEKYYNFAEVIEKERAFSLTLFGRVVDTIARQTSKARQLPYDEEKLKDVLYDVLKAEFNGLGDRIGSVREAIDAMFHVLRTPSLPRYDGVDEIIRNSINQLYMSEALRNVDRRTHFNTLITKFEAFLKKVYYLVFDEEVPAPEGAAHGPSLANVLYAMNELWRLERDHNPEAKRLGQYLRNIRDWRNDESHTAQVVTDQELDFCLRQLVTMYIFSAGVYAEGL